MVNPNAGWATLNTTRVENNTTKVTANGEVLVLGNGRRTITTANAYQKMPLPSTGLKSCWNDFVRLYKNDLTVPLYSSLLVGAWNTTTESGGDNVRLRGVFYTTSGIIAVGYHTGTGNELPLSNVPSWGTNNFNSGVNTSVFAYLDTSTSLNSSHFQKLEQCLIYPNPSNSGEFNITIPNDSTTEEFHFEIYAVDGKLVSVGNFVSNIENKIHIEQNGIFFIKISDSKTSIIRKLIKN